MSKIQIVVPCFNRKKVTELSLNSIKTGMNTEDLLILDNDHSTEYDSNWLKSFTNNVNMVDSNTHKLDAKNRISKIRSNHFRDFIKSDYDYLYLTDNDAVHDPNWRDMIMELYGKWKLPDGRKLPVTLYNTIHHSQIGNTIKETDSIILRKTAPGISQFYDRSMCELIITHLNNNPQLETTYGWDYWFVTPLNRPFITSKVSYVEHYSRDEKIGGIHSTFSGNGIAGRVDFERDRALNPTEYLSNNRNDIIDYILGIKEKPNND